MQLAGDIISILNIFSAKINGSRKYKIKWFLYLEKYYIFLHPKKKVKYKSNMKQKKLKNNIIKNDNEIIKIFEFLKDEKQDFMIEKENNAKKKK